jgi:PPM family protein phosphatase
MTVSGAGATDIGKRKHNEDNVLVRPDLQLFALADGAGGHNAGNVASALATTTIANFFEATEARFAMSADTDAFGLSIGARRLATALQKANREIVEIAKASNKYKGMGTTIVAVSVQPASGLIHVGSVGDSRCYRLREGLLEQLTHDHSLINDVLELRPDIDDATLARLPQHVVTRALGMEENVRVSVRTLLLLPGDKYLLTSDGMSDVLAPEQLGDVLRMARAPEEIVRTLVDLAVGEGAEDNVAGVVISCEISPGAPLFPKRRALSWRPARAPSAPPPAENTEHSDPEIVIVGSETYVIPPESATPSLMDTLGGFAQRVRSGPVDEDTTRPSPQCAECGQPLEASATACPTCGAKRG